jgi:four helix bundle protein
MTPLPHRAIMRDSSKLRLTSEAEDLAVAVYRATASFPRDERFGLTAQMRRAAVSIGSNVVEGCHRQGNKAFVAFLYHALGSAAELLFQIGLAMKLGMGDDKTLAALASQATDVKKMTSRLIASLKNAGD